MGDGNEKKRKPTVENGFQVGIKRGGEGEGWRNLLILGRMKSIEEK